ncbi:SAM-dependent chlorinase/fluorinase [Allocoleopsis sp.]|uniref:SAM hydrolase/SAM-dependent halogenase family protein n=1 Tax=Allocoleopsis sp. TaxID=3088169 RepID=UPI002FD3621B
MTENRLITLLSDFGLKDVYVGVMKGVIAQINPALTVIDLTHQIPPQNIAAARFNLMNAYSYFPVGTVHVAVVDPGVGSQRRGIAVQIDQGFLVGPDNGLFSGVLNQTRALATVELANPEYWRTPTPSSTFHGRDIFAAVGAHIASGVAIARLGVSIEPKTLVQLTIGDRTPTSSGVIGCIQYIDYFGNLITNIPAAEVQGKTWSVVLGDSPTQMLRDRRIESSQTYTNRPLGELVALIGSHGWVEIAVNGGNAHQTLQMDVGSPVEVVVSLEMKG